MPPPGGAAHLLNIVVQAADGKAGVVVILPNALWVLLGETRPGLSQRCWHTCPPGSCLGIHSATQPGVVRPHLVVLDQDVTGGIEDLRVQRVRVLGQGVVVVEAVDLDVAQADLVVGIDGRGVQETADLRGQEV